MNDCLKDYPIVMQQEVIWSDMDAYQHLNNTVYLRYFEDSRMRLFEQAGVVTYMEKHQVGPILASTNCNFRAPVTYPDTVHIAARIDEIKTRTIKMSYAVYSQKLDKLAAEGEGLVVFFDYKRNHSCEIPAVIVSALQELGG
jgi:acyl-CoA thioester hydrolase